MYSIHLFGDKQTISTNSTSGGACDNALYASMLFPQSLVTVRDSRGDMVDCFEGGLPAIYTSPIEDRSCVIMHISPEGGYLPCESIVFSSLGDMHMYLEHTGQDNLGYDVSWDETSVDTLASDNEYDVSDCDTDTAVQLLNEWVYYC